MATAAYVTVSVMLFSFSFSRTPAKRLVGVEAQIAAAINCLRSISIGL
ncbi:hypothetical protein [Sphingopyxis sp. BSNA05]|nr:hypothetical protein [Sphingopyxis sp. BSNA05]